jgi:Transposase IS116/IS110/IS902 family
VGPLSATTIVAAIGNGAAFGNGREFAAWLGLVPRQYSTRGRTRLLRISKRGNAYLRRMFIHGARAVLFRVKYDAGMLGRWAQQLQPDNEYLVVSGSTAIYPKTALRMVACTESATLATAKCKLVCRIPFYRPDR